MKTFTYLFNPFIKIAGFKSLALGLVGLAASSGINYFNQWHFHGLLHYGPAPNPAFWCFAAEQLVVWLIPSILFYIGGCLLSKSKIRMLDVFGTTAFALLPLLVMNLIYCLPILQPMKTLNAATPPLEMLQQPGIMVAIIASLFTLVFLIWALILLFNALKVSTNLNKIKLIAVYCIGVFGGDILCRLIINMFYK
ncbi:MAG: YIP1 family protein [Candidatus Azobacteroides sp.]|nr:YIP1 family protein [Candidatus Azobacteroides sp.]